MSDENKKGLSWFKWLTKDVKNYRAVLTNEQMGELFFAVMETVDTGQRVDVSNELKLAYIQLCSVADEAKTAYIKKCQQNALNGAKGGKAKAENVKSNNNCSFKQPTKTDFRKMAKNIKNNYDVCCDQYEIDQFFEKLLSEQWKFLNKTIKNQHQLEAVFYANFAEDRNIYRIVIEILKSDKDFDLDTIDSIYYELSKYNNVAEAVYDYFSDDE